MKIKEWQYRIEKIGANRLRLLQGETSFDSVAQRISNEITSICFYPKEGNRKARGKIRAEFYFDISRETFDIFFNSSYGYRAQYYLDTDNGLKYNRILIDMIRGKLIDHAMKTSQNKLTLKQVNLSLDYESAKVWIHEDSSTIDQVGQDPAHIVALEIPRWVAAMERVLDAWEVHKQPNPTIQTRALLGVQAPEGSRIEVLGAWLDTNNQEFIVPSKIHRAMHIHQYGFS
jgi:hypothetical protein